MRISVETYAGHRGMEMPSAFRLGRRRITIVETVDQWFGPEIRYVKVKGHDGSLYILCVDDGQGTWALTMFKSTRAQDLAANNGSSPHFNRLRHPA
jgi:hypothetical protein